MPGPMLPAADLPRHPTCCSPPSSTGRHRRYRPPQVRSIGTAFGLPQWINFPLARWAVVRSRRQPVEITSDEFFHVEVNGELKSTRMDFRHFTNLMHRLLRFAQARPILAPHNPMASSWRSSTPL